MSKIDGLTVDVVVGSGKFQVQLESGMLVAVELDLDLDRTDNVQC